MNSSFFHRKVFHLMGFGAGSPSRTSASNCGTSIQQSASSLQVFIVPAIASEPIAIALS